jgi:predicted RNA binding protein YcfA (HicA-like mRNA interferase family)
MARLPQLSGKDVQKALVRAGYYPVSQKGSHLKIRRDNPRRTVIVPNHKVIKKGTLRGIITDAGLTTEEFLNLLKRR